MSKKKIKPEKKKRMMVSTAASSPSASTSAGGPSVFIKVVIGLCCSCVVLLICVLAVSLDSFNWLRARNGNKSANVVKSYSYNSDTLRKEYNNRTISKRPSQVPISSTWASPILGEWGIEINGTEETQTSLDSKMRSLLLHEMLDISHKRSFLRPDMSSLGSRLIHDKWIRMPLPDGARHVYNPTRVVGTDVVLARNDNIHALWDSDAWYCCTGISQDMSSFSETYNDDDVLVFSKEGAPKEISSSSSRGVPMVYQSDPTKRFMVARSRAMTCASLPIIEDLRSVPCEHQRFTDSPLLTGVTMLDKHAKRVQTVAFRYDVQSSRLCYVSVINSPTGQNIEKNWLFVPSASSTSSYDVIYECDEYLTVYEWQNGESKLSTNPKHHVKVCIPEEWMPSTHLHTSQLRLSAVCVVDNGDTLMLLLHRKDDVTQYYSFYVLYLARETYQPIAYIPCPVFSELCFRVIFVMNIESDDRKYYFYTGISDEVGGVLVYDKNKWESLRRNFNISGSPK
jgi:hypothetical protein